MGLLKHSVVPMSSENLAVLSERCRDPSVSVKKKALQCLGELLTVSLICACFKGTKNIIAFAFLFCLLKLFVFSGQSRVQRGAEGVAAGSSASCGGL